MFFLTLSMLALFGGTTYLAQGAALTGDRELHHRRTALGLVLSFAAVLAVVGVAVVTRP